mmetsp:Transcript_20479/g.78520  ORF Transcript_20479/g.78520 Transcript_20479/m.78520 type:complete len:204 (-) Transcript_20479:908-1519(-)
MQRGLGCLLAVELHGKPRVRKRAMDVEAPLHVHLDQFRDEVLRLPADVCPQLLRLEAVLTVLDLLEQRRREVLVERRKARQQHVEQHACTPHVHCHAVAALRQPLGCQQHLWCDILRCTAKGAHHSLSVDNARQAKVGELDVGIRPAALEQNILGLEVAVCSTARMKVLQSIQNLVEDPPGVLFRKFLPLLQIVEQIAPTRQF